MEDEGYCTVGCNLWWKKIGEYGSEPSEWKVLEEKKRKEKGKQVMVCYATVVEPHGT